MAYPSEGRGPYLHIEIAIGGLDREKQTIILDHISRTIAVDGRGFWLGDDDPMTKHIAVVLNTVRNRVERKVQPVKQQGHKAANPK